MDDFQLLGSLAAKLHGDLRSLYYLFLPVFFCVSLCITWLSSGGAGPDFVLAVKRVFVATLLLVAFPEISDTILLLTKELADRISDMSGLDAVMQMAGNKANGYTLSTISVLQGFNDLIIAGLTFVSYVLLYLARFVMVALYHFSWVFLTIMSPFLLLFHVFNSRITAGLFRSMLEVASWRVVWAVLSAILASLPFGDAYAAPDSSYLTVVVLNFVVALCLVATPIIVHSLVGSGFSSFASTLAPAITSAMIAAPLKASSLVSFSRGALGGGGGGGTSLPRLASVAARRSEPKGREAHDS